MEQVERHITNEEVFAKLCAVEALLQKSVINENSKALWSLQDIANYFDYTYRHIQSIVAEPNFPKPICLPQQRDINKPTKDKRWFIGDIVRYAERKKKW